MRQALDRRRQKGTLRVLPNAPNVNVNDNDNRDGNFDAPPCPSATSLPLHVDDTTDDSAIIDFSSNDYLGLAHDPTQLALCRHADDARPATTLGATGSRLLSGDSPSFHSLESYLAEVHRRPAALLFNSGYDANLSVVMSLSCQFILYDEYAHNSLHMGIRLWKSAVSPSSNRQAHSFRHNDVTDLDRQLQAFSSTRGRHPSLPPSNETPHPIAPSVVVLIESVYSMDGDVAPIPELLRVCHKYGAVMVVDEAHGLGVFGRRPSPSSSSSSTTPTSRARNNDDDVGGTGVLAEQDVEDHPSLLCSIHTFGKAAGCHGAVVCGSRLLKEYLVNYAYPLVYSTALPHHSLMAIRCAYETLTSHKGDELRHQLATLIQHFRDLFHSHIHPYLHDPTYITLLPSHSPIQALTIPGNMMCTDVCRTVYRLSKKRIRLYPIKAPTVPPGQERIRIVLHAHNTLAQVEYLISLLHSTLQHMGLLLLWSTAPPSRL